MKNKHGIKEMVSRYLKEGSTENKKLLLKRLSTRKEDNPKYTGPERRTRDELLGTKLLLQKDLDDVAAAKKKKNPQNDWTEYEGPSLSEQADYIARFLEDTVVEGKYRGTLTPEQVDAMTAREKREYEQMLKDNSAAVADTPWSKANKKKDEEKPENSSTEYEGTSLEEQGDEAAAAKKKKNLPVPVGRVRKSGADTPLKKPPYSRRRLPSPNVEDLTEQADYIARFLKDISETTEDILKGKKPGLFAGRKKRAQYSRLRADLTPSLSSKSDGTPEFKGPSTHQRRVAGQYVDSKSVQGRTSGQVRRERERMRSTVKPLPRKERKAEKKKFHNFLSTQPGPKNDSTEYEGPSLSEQADYIARFLEEGKRLKAAKEGIKGAVKKIFKRKPKDARTPDQIERDQARDAAFAEDPTGKAWEEHGMSKLGADAKTARSHQIRGKQRGGHNK
tara:strand:+ start:697 stop:2037 length:1341 start_codon:yes stop_codon:yes gene_type:complete